MQQIKCPKCGEFFTIDESGYANIVKQVRDKEFKQEIDKQVIQLNKEKEQSIKIAVNEKDSEIQKLQHQIEMIEKQKEFEINKALSTEKERQQSELIQRDDEIKNLKQQLKRKEEEKKNEIIIVTNEKDMKIEQLTSEIKILEREKKLGVDAEKEKYEAQLKEKDNLIDYYKDFKLKQSTKLLGETLEQHCEIEFNKLRSLGFQNAYFQKDNNAKSGSKGDYIFRDYIEDLEIVSIMFEMKNEMDTTTSKRKNEDFLKELDKDRNEKKCEYAILVSMLERGNDLYDSGIVDMSYKYPKMYVIRPQFFIPMITLIRNEAIKVFDAKKALRENQLQNLDITNFETCLYDFKNDFSRNYRLAEERFASAIDEIDKSINHLQKIKEALRLSGKHLGVANDKAEGLTIKSLTKNNPTMALKFEELKNKNAVE